MHTAVRSPLAAGVALVGAGVIGVPPVGPPLPRTAHLPAIELTDAYTDLFDNTATNLQALADMALAGGPAPILQQILDNQVASWGVLTDATQQAWDLMGTMLGSTLPAALQTAGTEFVAGDIFGAADALWLPLYQLNQVLPSTLGFALGDVLANPVTNLANVLERIPFIATVSTNAVTFPLLSTFMATASATQEIQDSLLAGDFGQFFEAVVASPAVVADGLINGFTIPGTPFDVVLPGILGSTMGAPAAGNPGLIASILAIRSDLADVIAPTVAPLTGLSLAPNGIGTVLDSLFGGGDLASYLGQVWDGFITPFADLLTPFIGIDFGALFGDLLAMLF